MLFSNTLLETRRQSRRGFLRLGTAGLAGLNLSHALRLRAADSEKSAAPKARNVIMVFLTGGPSTIDMWDLKPDAPDTIRGEFRPRETSVPGIQICEHLPRLAECMQLASLVRSVTHTIAEHTQGQSYVMTGNAPSPSVSHPSLGSLSASLASSGLGVPSYATMGDVPAGGAGDLGNAFDPFAIAAVGDQPGQPAPEAIRLPEGFSKDLLARRLAIRDRLDDRLDDLPASDLPSQLDQFQLEAAEILRSDKINQALRVDLEPETVRARYGRSSFGMHALAARRLIEAGTRFVTIGFGDWDTHANNFTRLQQSLLPQLDNGLAALLTDLSDRGQLHDTIVYCTGEFGRTPAVNATSGRDHWARTMTALVAGGGFRTGYVHGATDEEAAEPTTDPCTPDDVSATIFSQLGFAPSENILTRSGRPVAIFKKGRVMTPLIG